MNSSFVRRLALSVTLLVVELVRPALGVAQTEQESSREMVFGEWIDATAALIDSTSNVALEREYEVFADSHQLPKEDVRLRRDYFRVRFLFEAVRDGGFWHLRWAVTDQYPSSKRIWRSWSQGAVLADFGEPSATAECDESSALLGMLARHMNVSNVGLFYPTWNHTIAVWAPLAGAPKTPLVQLPTTQIFLDCAAGYDRTSFQTRLRNIERYPNLDLRRTDRLTSARAAWLFDQLRINASASPTLWSLMRAKRAYIMGSTMGSCLDVRSRWREELKAHLTAGDIAALLHLGRRELRMPQVEPTRVLDWLAE